MYGCVAQKTIVFMKDMTKATKNAAHSTDYSNLKHRPWQLARIQRDAEEWAGKKAVFHPCYFTILTTKKNPRGLIEAMKANKKHKWKTRESFRWLSHKTAISAHWLTYCHLRIYLAKTKFEVHRRKEKLRRMQDVEKLMLSSFWILLSIPYGIFEVFYGNKLT